MSQFYFVHSGDEIWPTVEATQKAFYQWIDAEFPADPAVSEPYGITSCAPAASRLLTVWRPGPTALRRICKQMAVLCSYDHGNFPTGWTMGCVGQAMETLFMKFISDDQDYFLK